ncbi:hypothetical protein KVP40.0309 [Vibrio phage KVP40]|uniref:Uncharacterized protein n=1 Tax=Vibrio phage KVP40 (isolate Vibrio parahaemolyticus/Japan/Matsuzaki/1991) TaxID=75320 RepID=Q6WHJ5_BPKVM|nr:hypothetical protein KVP40.0309 [Vibrio phage KVP40]AAQ64378.1 hypothetical protein KVP40.0309 [Vibrio phage KVP40]
MRFLMNVFHYSLDFFVTCLATPTAAAPAATLAPVFAALPAFLAPDLIRSFTERFFFFLSSGRDSSISDMNLSKVFSLMTYLQLIEFICI